MTAILDPGALQTLGRDLGDDAAHEFAATYAAMLEDRVSRLDSSVAAGDLEEAYVAALSLHSASAMVGAQALAETAATVAAALRRRDPAPALSARGSLAALAEQTRACLAALRAGHGAPG